MDTYVYEQLWRILGHQHPNKLRKWQANFNCSPGNRFIL
ncbi:MAG: hypothetical protein GXP08_18085 [Gammaproteobacteria bacterium]|nr:hypothetical protein [Gammaproteobacteria bacterium]